MNTQDRDNQLTVQEKKMYLTGAFIFIVGFTCTIFFGDFFSPLKLLQLRLSIVGTGLLYNLAVYIYHDRTQKQLQEKRGQIEHGIIILFNGKELEEKKH
ncbi:hypothetical protein AWH56_003625 [Anaerobacillus isosaccharinicus]|uniref:Uncharacterized protein n=1 Tax=Anaerobacillus isosaccharinicus TaxID=1532552 RepID=A0A1S2LEV7_9BACI|nr:hypothetical protein [Anaerobacillus isosaccharinicus]MBA5584883.1 hypothetical protein [Anaerobacillus isosaccharinicus]QOY36756.1 hypothetical protein AWH56_003625 [Anaerobacillus isosaccharinicus]